MRWGLFLFCMIVFAGCSQKSTPRADVPGTPLRLAVNEKVTRQKITVQITQIRESRCPLNARCIRAGEAIASFSVTDQFKTDSFSLCTGTDCRQQHTEAQTTITLSGSQYQFVLADIVPNPTKTLQKDTKKAVFTIKKIY